MSTVRSFILKLENDRFRLLLDCSAENEQFAQPVEDFIYSKNLPLPCFILNSEGHVSHIAAGRKGVKAGTGMRRLNLSELLPLERPVSLGEIIERAPRRTHTWIEQAFLEGGLLPPKSTEGLIDALIRISPELSSALGRFSRARRERLGRLSPEKLDALAMQRESVVTAMAIAGIDKQTLKDWTLKTDDEPTSFLDGLDEARVREDPMVVNDLNKVPGFELIRDYQYGAAVFEQEPDRFNSESARLTVILANRQPLEAQTGADLIYYNERFRSFILVQYKAMEQEGDVPVFRFPSRQLDEEIERMDGVLLELQKCADDNEKGGFRLNGNPFFLKFCPRINKNLSDSGMTNGIYIPLDYWKRSQDCSTMLGPRGGKLLTYKNIERYFDNTQFVNLVSNSWVGTTINQSASLTAFVRETIESGKAIVLAIKVSDPDDDEGDVPSIEAEYTDDVSSASNDNVQIHLHNGD